MTARVGSSLLNVPSHRRTASLSFHRRTLWGAKVDRLGGEARRREQKGEAERAHQDALRPGRKSSGRASVHRDERVGGKPGVPRMGQRQEGQSLQGNFLPRHPGKKPVAKANWSHLCPPGFPGTRLPPSERAQRGSPTPTTGPCGPQPHHPCGLLLSPASLILSLMLPTLLCLTLSLKESRK